MRLLAAAMVLFFCAAAPAEVARFGLREASVYQRGILKTSSAETPVEVFISGGKTLRAALAGGFGKMASVEVEGGRPVFARGSAFFPDKLAEKFFLRDVMLCAGFYEFFLPQIVHASVDALGRPRAAVLLGEGCFAEFRYARDADIVPSEVRIERAGYKLELKTVKAILKDGH